MEQELKDALEYAEAEANELSGGVVARLSNNPERWLPGAWASMILAKAYREEHDKRTRAELETAVILQDLDTIREIIRKGGDAHAVLKFLETETTKGHK